MMLPKRILVVQERMSNFLSKKKVEVTDSKLTDRKDRSLNNIFSFVEAEINEDLVITLQKSLHCYSRNIVDAVEIREELNLKGLEEVKVLKINCFTVLINKGVGEEWLEEELELLRNHFIKVKKYDSEDYLVPRAVEIECLGLPLNAWLEENIKAFTSQLGEWISWSYQDEQRLEIFNPRITCFSKRLDKIDEKFLVLVNGENYKVTFKELEFPWFSSNLRLADNTSKSLSRNMVSKNDFLVDEPKEENEDLSDASRVLSQALCPGSIDKNHEIDTFCHGVEGCMGN